MKTILYTILIITMIGTCYAQSEPQGVKTTDIIEEIDRSDIESENINDIDSETIVPKLEMPTIDFSDGIKTNANKTDSKKEVVKKEVVKKEVVKKEVVKKETEKRQKKNKVIISKKKILPGQLKANDKIVIRNGITYIYRLSKLNIIQYKYNGKLPLDSTALKPSGNNSYYITNIEKFRSDIKPVVKTKKVTKPKVAAKKRRPQRKTRQPKKKPASEPMIVASAELKEKRKKIEETHNNGEKIEKSIKLQNLVVNDQVYIIGDIQLVVRKNKKVPGSRKYWLIEKINYENRALEKRSENKYKVIKYYRPD